MNTPQTVQVEAMSLSGTTSHGVDASMLSSYVAKFSPFWTLSRDGSLEGTFKQKFYKAAIHSLERQIAMYAIVELKVEGCATAKAPYSLSYIGRRKGPVREGKPTDATEKWSLSWK
jgi:hypothetical protein